ncbi:SET and MYND domain-containing protein 4 isoform X1 [Triplophysa dalaica]|uniref:SET and MYND domain-containing protein 4 isoform X1 n=1 Tax=Triplophysa dalaica TaxID=1582913 RepID=UPI0024DFCF6B|nr:SET and MYND domain-containing protein 4 isoform X1 [Triplophysa dalaica]
MDLPCQQWVRHVEQKWTGLGPEGRERFSILADINDIFNNALSLTQPDDLNTLSIISDKYSVKKSPEPASEFREQGNLSFKVKDYTSAALFYSKGICHADKNTEQLSLCYANRSAALFYLTLYKECLEDIRQALEAGYPSHLRDKLITRKTACLNQLSKLEKSNTPAPNNPPPPSTSHGVSVYFSPGKGRHLLATENKLAGDVVLVDEAYGCVLIPGIKLITETEKTVFDTEDRHCHHCLCRTLSSVPCPNCSYARYCDERCRKEAWSQWHQWECAVGADLLVLGVLTHLALRVALKAGQKEVQSAKESSCPVENQAGLFKSDSSVQLNFEGHCTKSSDHTDCYHGNSYLGIYSLLPHVGEHSPSLRFLLAVTTATLYKKLHGGPPSDMWESCEDDRGAWKPEMSMLGATVLRHLMQLRCNAQAVTAIRVTEETGTSVQPSNEIRIATAIFPVLSLLNHSCSPNTSIFFTTGFINNQLTQFSGSSQGDHSETLHSGVTVTLRTSKDLMAGQEILHCYGPHCSRMTVKERQRLLLEQYFFTCDCVACLREHAENKTSEDRKTALGLKCENCEQPLQAYMERYVCSQPSCSHQITSAEVQKKLQGLQNLLDQAIHLMERDRSDDALRILKSASSQADSILTDTHPVKGELADATARVYATNGDWSRAASHLKLSIVAIKAQYGEDCVELGRQFFKLAQLHFNGGDRRATLSVIPKARRLLSLHCGPLCEELQELQEMEHCLK